MSSIHYFQRYSSKENTVTNNTLLLFSRLYHHDSRAFKDFLNQLLDEQTTPINSTLKFEQQTSGRNSVPDGSITQESFKVVIETKLYGQENIDQILKHTDSFEGEKNKYLMLINVHQISKDYEKKVLEKLTEKGREIQLISTTFEDIIVSFRAVIKDYDVEMNMIIDDYEDYCNSANLISIEDRLMRVLPVGKTLDHNFKYKLYYAPASRTYNRRHRYLGLYNQKEVKGVGEIKLIIDADYSKETKELKCQVVEGDKEILDDIKNNIVQAMIHGEEEFGYQIYNGHRFFIVPEFIETTFKKKSSGGLLGARYFDLAEYKLDKEELNIEMIVEKLRAESWE